MDRLAPIGHQNIASKHTQTGVQVTQYQVQEETMPQAVQIVLLPANKHPNQSNSILLLAVDRESNLTNVP